MWGVMMAGCGGHHSDTRSRTARRYGNDLVLLLTNLLTIALASECLFDALLLAWLQIKRVSLDFLDNVFGLDLALEAAQGILKRFTFLNSDLCHETYTSKQS